MILYPNEILRQVAEPVSKEDIKGDIRNIINQMVGEMNQYDGVGIAAPQIGISKRVFLARICGSLHGGEILCAINPILELSGDTISFEEGCLSLPGIKAQVDRKNNAILTATNEDGIEYRRELEGLEAVICQHELDHLDGILFIDRVSRQVRKRLMKIYE